MLSVFLRRTLEIPAKKTYHNVCLHYIQKKIPMEKTKNFASKIKHAEDLLSLNIKHTESSKTEHAASLLRP